MEKLTNNPHSGHRKRLRTLIEKVGLDSLSDVQIVEQILTMSNCRSDTNVIAHRLLKKYGSISKILDADYQDLMEVEGVGPVTAQTLTYLPQIFQIYLRDKNKKKFPCRTMGDIYNYFKVVFAETSREQFVIAFINHNGMFEDFQVLSTGEMVEVTVDKMDISKAVIRHKASSVIVAHNHPFGSSSPSAQDYDAHIYLSKFFSALGVILIDDIIMGTDGMFSFKNTEHYQF